MSRSDRLLADSAIVAVASASEDGTTSDDGEASFDDTMMGGDEGGFGGFAPQFFGGSKETAVLVHKDAGPSTWNGVFLPVSLAIFGAVLFLRLPYCIGHAGLYLTIVGILCCFGLSGITLISLAAITTNGLTSKGGPYMMVSRTVGPQFGLGIGVLFVVANLIANAMYLVATAPVVSASTEIPGVYLNPTMDSSRRYWTTVAISSVLLLFLMFVALLKQETKFRSISFVLTVIALIDLIVKMGRERGDGDSLSGFTGLNSTTFEHNLKPQFHDGIDFTNILAILLPGATGILSGITLSGELRNASKAMPRGIAYAWGSSLVTYLVMAVLISASYDGAHLRTSLSPLHEDNPDLRWLFAPGQICACFASVLAGLGGSSKVINGIATDDLVPITAKFSQKLQKYPRLGLALCYVVIQGLIFIGPSVYNRASVWTSVAFCTVFLTLNLGTFLTRASGVASFRPTYSFFNKHTAIIGALGSLVMMFVVGPLQSAGAIFVLILLVVGFEALHDPRRVTWGDASQPITFHLVRKWLLHLDVRKEHPSHWRPNVLQITTDIERSQNLVHFANNLKKGGLYQLGIVVRGDFASSRVAVSRWKDVLLCFIRASGIKGFPAVSFGASLRCGVQHILTGAGLGGMRPNTLLINIDDYMERAAHNARAFTHQSQRVYAPRPTGGYHHRTNSNALAGSASAKFASPSSKNFSLSDPVNNPPPVVKPATVWAVSVKSQPKAAASGPSPLPTNSGNLPNRDSTRSLPALDTAARLPPRRAGRVARFVGVDPETDPIAPPLDTIARSAIRTTSPLLMESPRQLPSTSALPPRPKSSNDLDGVETSMFMRHIAQLDDNNDNGEDRDDESQESRQATPRLRTVAGTSPAAAVASASRSMTPLPAADDETTRADGAGAVRDLRPTGRGDANDEDHEGEPLQPMGLKRATAAFRRQSIVQVKKQQELPETKPTGNYRTRARGGSIANRLPPFMKGGVKPSAASASPTAAGDVSVSPSPVQAGNNAASVSVDTSSPLLQQQSALAGGRDARIGLSPSAHSSVKSGVINRGDSAPALLLNASRTQPEPGPQMASASELFNSAGRYESQSRLQQKQGRSGGKTRVFATNRSDADEDEEQAALRRMGRLRADEAILDGPDLLTYADANDLCGTVSDACQSAFSVLLARNFSRLDRDEVEGCKLGAYVDLWLVGEDDPIMFLTAHCLSLTSVWSHHATLRVVGLSWTQEEAVQAQQVTENILKHHRINAEVYVIVLQDRSETLLEAITPALLRHVTATTQGSPKGGGAASPRAFGSPAGRRGGKGGKFPSGGGGEDNLINLGMTLADLARTRVFEPEEGEHPTLDTPPTSDDSAPSLARLGRSCPQATMSFMDYGRLLETDAETAKAKIRRAFASSIEDPVQRAITLNHLIKDEIKRNGGRTKLVLMRTDDPASSKRDGLAGALDPEVEKREAETWVTHVELLTDMLPPVVLFCGGGGMMKTPEW
jgi:amino acid transporter